MTTKNMLSDVHEKKKKLQKIAVVTSGGDAPGMNAAIRAVTRAAIAHKLKVVGIRRGYQGMIEGDFIPLKASDVSGILQLGGTMLKTARSAAFRTPEGRELAYQQLKINDIDAVVVIGGDGSFTGALEMSLEFNISFVGIPATIDQRGGSPTAKDRVNATRIGVAAVEALLDDQKSIMIGLCNEKIVQVPFNKAVKLNHSIDLNLLEIQRLMNC